MILPKIDAVTTYDQDLPGSTAGSFSVNTHRASGRDRMLVIGAAWNRGGAHLITSVTCNGRALTALTLQTSGAQGLQVWITRDYEVPKGPLSITFSHNNGFGVVPFVTAIITLTGVQRELRRYSLYQTIEVADFSTPNEAHLPFPAPFGGRIVAFLGTDNVGTITSGQDPPLANLTRGTSPQIRLYVTTAVARGSQVLRHYNTAFWDANVQGIAFPPVRPRHATVERVKAKLVHGGWR